MINKNMKIYTSYYSNTKKLLDNNILPIAISLFTPKDLNLIQYKELAPTYSMFKNLTIVKVPGNTESANRNKSSAMRGESI